MRAFSSFCRALLKDRVLWGACALLAAFALLPTVLASPVYGISAQRDELEQAYENLSSGLDSGAFDTAPDALKDLLRAKKDALEAAISAGDDAAFYSAAAEVDQLDLEGVKMGYLACDEEIVRAGLAYSSAMAASGSVASAGDVSQLPALESLIVAIASMPVPVWFCAAFVVIARALKLSGAGALFEAPCVGRVESTLLKLVPAVVCSWLGLMAAFAPPMLLALAKNGAGDPDQPLTYVVGSDVHTATAGSTGCYLFVYLIFGTMFLICLALFFALLARSPAAGLAAALVAAALPSVPAYFDVNGPVSEIVALLPTTYLAPSAFLPSAGSPPYQLLPCQAVIDPLVGLGILAGSSIALAALAIALDSVRGRRLAHAQHR